MQTSLPPNRRAKERHQETQLRRELQKRIRSGGKRRACTVPVVNAAEPRNPSEKLPSMASPEVTQEDPSRPSQAHRAPHERLATRLAIETKPCPCSSRGSDWTGSRAWNHSTSYSADHVSLQTCSPRTAKAGSRQPPALRMWFSEPSF